MQLIKRSILCLSLCGFASGALAAQVDSTAAASAVKGWLRLERSPLGEPLGTQVARVETFKDQAGAPLYHVVYLQPSGFVIVSAEDQVEPIIAFARKGHFDASITNPLGALVTRDVPARVARARAKTATSAKPVTQNKWQTFQRSAAGGPQPMGISTGLISEPRIAPFVTSTWDQAAAPNGAACYNFFTPPYEAGNPSNYVCGCVATAMAQLMYYYQYPTVGVGTPEFVITVNNVPMTRHLRGGNGLGTPYAWNNMVASPVNPTATQCQAIGALTYDAGIAVHMAYTISGSGAYMSDAKAALTETFQYSSAILAETSGTNNSLNVGVDLMSMINPNLDAHMPVLLGVDGDGGGHAIVCDGYGYSYWTLYHHLNLGWSGEETAWYALPIIDLGPEEFFLNIDACIYNAFTSKSGEIISGRVLDTGGVPVPNAAISATRLGGGSYTTLTDTNGIYALAGVPSSSSYTLTVTTTGFYPASTDCVTALSADYATNSGNVWGVNFTLVAAQGPPSITTQPADQAVCLGDNACFTVNAGGQLPLAYQWQIQPAGTSTWLDLCDDQTYSGSQTPALTVVQPGPALDGAPFRCVVTNQLGSASTSPGAVLRVNHVGSSVQISTLAGLAGTNGSADGLNKAALFNNPHGIAVDSNTNIYVADMYSSTIRKLSPAGTNWVVTTIAGLAGNNSSLDGTNSAARFDAPYGIAVGGTNLYVADTGNNTIRKLTPVGTNWVVTTIAGLAGSSGTADGTASSARFHFPTGIAADSNGNLYVADEANSIIRKLTPMGTSWSVGTIAGLALNSGSADGTNNVARFNSPYGLAADRAGNVYVADTGNSTIRKLAPLGNNWVVTTLAGLAYSSGSSDGAGLVARFSSPTGIALDNGTNLYVADKGNNAIRKLALSGSSWLVSTIAGAGTPGSADGVGSAAQLNAPFGVAVDSNTNLYVSDSLNNTIRGTPLATPAAAQLVQLAKQSAGSGQLIWRALAGQRYLVQYKTNFAQPAWSDLVSLTASNWTGTASIPIGKDSQGFYRVLLVP